MPLTWLISGLESTYSVVRFSGSTSKRPHELWMSWFGMIWHASWCRCNQLIAWMFKGVDGGIEVEDW